MKTPGCISICLLMSLLKVALAYSDLSDYQEARPLRLQSKSVSNRTLPYYLDLDFTEEQSAFESDGLVRHLLSSGAPIDCVREVTISVSQLFENWTLVQEFFAKATGLRDVHWKGQKPISKTILGSIEKNTPSCRLHYHVSFPYWIPYVGDISPEDPRYEERKEIFGSKSLYSFKSEIEYGIGPGLEDLDFVFQVLVTCPNLKKLNLSIIQGGGCEPVSGPSGFDILSNPESRFPPLESLTLSGYNLNEASDGNRAWWEEKRTPWRERLRWPWTVFPVAFVEWMGEFYIDHAFGGISHPTRSPRTCDPRTSLDCWLEVMDWSHLQSLTLAWPDRSTLERLNSEDLPNLNNLTLIRAEIADNYKAVVDFLANTSRPLEVLSLQNMDFPASEGLVVVITANHSAYLRSLDIHQREENWSSNGPPPIIFNSTELQTVISSLPELEHLSVDLSRNETLLFEHIHLLTAARKLKSLTLHFVSPDQISGMGYVEIDLDNYYMNDKGDVVDPLVNRSSVAEMYSALRRGKEGEELKTLEVEVGNWDARYLSGEMVPRVRKRVASYICLVDDEGMEICEGKQMVNIE